MPETNLNRKFFSFSSSTVSVAYIYKHGTLVYKRCCTLLLNLLISCLFPVRFTLTFNFWPTISEVRLKFPKLATNYKSPKRHIQQIKKPKPYYTVRKHDGHLRTRGKCRKHAPQTSVFYIYRVFSNDRGVLSQCNTRPRLRFYTSKTMKHAFSMFYTLIKPWIIKRLDWKLADVTVAT